LDGSFETLESASRKLQELELEGVVGLWFSSVWGFKVVEFEFDSHEEGLKNWGGGSFGEGSLSWSAIDSASWESRCDGNPWHTIAAMWRWLVEIFKGGKNKKVDNRENRVLCFVVVWEVRKRSRGVGVRF